MTVISGLGRNVSGGSPEPWAPTPNGGHAVSPPAEAPSETDEPAGRSDRDRGRPPVADHPAHGWGHPRDVLVAEVEEVRVALAEEIVDDHGAFPVQQGDRRDRLVGAPHLRAGSHGGSLDHTRVISSIPGGDQVSLPGGVSQYEASAGRCPTTRTCVPTGTSG